MLVLARRDERSREEAEAKALGAKTLGAKAPKAKAPETKAPETKAPKAKALETEAGFGNDRFRLVQHIPSPEVCMEVLKECSKVCPEELYGVAASIRPEVMNGEMADFLLPLDGRCISVLPVHLQTQKRVLVAAETSGMSASGVAECRKACSRPKCMSGAPPTAGSR